MVLPVQSGPAVAVPQLLQALQHENARLEAALEWRRLELVFWKWMVRKPAPAS